VPKEFRAEVRRGLTEPFPDHTTLHIIISIAADQIVDENSINDPISHGWEKAWIKAGRPELCYPGVN
jgi:hypothetical protein